MKELIAPGTIAWGEPFVGRGWDWAFSFQQTSVGGCILAGARQSFGAGGDVYLIKVHGGAIYWRRAGPTLVEP